jgi:hypothetical protein
VNRLHQSAVLLREDGTFLIIVPSGTVAIVIPESAPTEPSWGGVRVVTERGPARVEGWPDEEGHYLVSSQAALAARALGLTTPARIYSPEALQPRTDGEKGMYAAGVRRWPDWPSQR